MAARLRLRSLAKINLDLRVLHKRGDGFHEIRTVFQTISLADTIEIEYRAGRARVDIVSNLNISGNIIERAADMVLGAIGRTGQLRFVLKKRIPLGGGLGGGSSNAATVLLGLPRLLGKPLPLGKLWELAAELGSDVPFFLLGGTALGIGRGHEIYPLPDVPQRPALVVAPGIHVSTPDAYRALGRGTAEEPSADSIQAFLPVAWAVGASGWTNDFEPVVFREHPQLKSIKGKLLKLGARPAMMSGSGSSVFGVFETVQGRDLAAASIGNERNRVYPVTIVSRSQYRALWRRQLAALEGT